MPSHGFEPWSLPELVASWTSRLRGLASALLVRSIVLSVHSNSVVIIWFYWTNLNHHFLVFCGNKCPYFLPTASISCCSISVIVISFLIPGFLYVSLGVLPFHIHTYSLRAYVPCVAFQVYAYVLPPCLGLISWTILTRMVVALTYQPPMSLIILFLSRSLISICRWLPLILSGHFSLIHILLRDSLLPFTTPHLLVPDCFQVTVAFSIHSPCR